MRFCLIFALESNGIINSFGERVKIALPLLTLFTGLEFMTETMMSRRCSKSTEYKLLFNRVSKLLKTRILLSTKLLCCSPLALGRMLQPGQGLWLDKETNVE